MSVMRTPGDMLASRKPSTMDNYGEEIRKAVDGERKRIIADLKAHGGFPDAVARIRQSIIEWEQD